MTDIRQSIERFLALSKEPALCEAGEEILALSGDNFALNTRGGSLCLQAWNDRRNLVRRVTAIREESRGKLVLEVERFAKRPGVVALVDLGSRAGRNAPQKGVRLEFREQFRRFLRRQFPSLKIGELTTEADLEHSLSPVYPRALLRQGASAWAAIGAPDDPCHSDGVLTFGLIWLDYLRRREPELAIQGLILYLSQGREKATCLRLQFLDPQTANYRVFAYSDPGDHGDPQNESEIDLSDCGNLETRLDRPRTERETAAGRETRSQWSPEAQLEAVVRNKIDAIDAELLPDPIYGQVPAFAATNRGILDLLAVDRLGRLAVLELKISEDIHLPLQALDYWMRVKWHLDRGDFRARGYFTERELSRVLPRLLLVSPALDFHPTNERVLRFFAPSVPVERLGVGLEWRKEPKVMFRS